MVYHGKSWNAQCSREGETRCEAVADIEIFGERVEINYDNALVR